MTSPDVRIALLVTCLNDAVFPGAGVATETVLRRLGHEVVFPTGQTCCGQMHWNSGYRREALSLVRHTVDDARAVRGRRLPVRLVHRDDPRAVRTRGGRCRATMRCCRLSRRCAGASSSCRSCSSTGSASRTWAPSCTRAPSTTRPATRCAASRSATGPTASCARCAGSSSIDLPRADECCGFGGTFAVKNADTSAAMGEDKAAAVRASGARGAGRRRPVVPDAHRRRPGTRRLARADDAPRRGARRGERLVTSVHEPPVPFPRGRPRRARQRADAREPARRDRHDPREARVASSTSCPTGKRCAWRARRSSAGRSATSTATSRSSRRASRRAGGIVHWARDASDAAGIVTRLVARRGRRRDRQGQVDGDRRDRPQRGARPRRRARDRDRPRRADRAARRRVAVAHRGARDPQEPHRDPRSLPRRVRAARPQRRADRARRGGAAAPARAVPAGRGGRVGRQLRASPRPGPSRSSSPRGTGACARPSPAS